MLVETPTKIENINIHLTDTKKPKYLTNNYSPNSWTWGGQCKIKRCQTISGLQYSIIYWHLTTAGVQFIIILSVCHVCQQNLKLYVWCCFESIFQYKKILNTC